MKQLPLPIPPALDRWPELAALAILDAALSATESALLAACPAIRYGALEHASRGSTTLRANSIILQARRLAAAIASYRNAVDREARRGDRGLLRLPF